MSSPIPDYPLRALNRELARHYAGRRVLVTGHTGFKGSWLCEWLLHLGAEVYGFGLEPPTNPSLFNLLSLSTRIHTHQIGDIRDLKTVKKSVKETKPDYVFHLAAQPLVRASYQNPIETWETNVIGSINVMEAVRESLDKCSVLMITTDKCYRNTESTFGYVESDPLGGNDPYSSSKAAAELSIHSWIHSFFTRLKGIKVASARAGNVIGGGDWALDRIVP
ncbi:MAG TPA: CDP-glucose 4,6-dehydratase, partial [Opitutales bacterium]|nr:CDP-glucose 4,6-dehydratase [Opitutales bacterium]